MSNILTIYLKELKDTTRDKRTLYAMVLMPVIIMPLLLIGITKFSQYQEQQAQSKTVLLAVATNQKDNPIIKAIALQDKVSITAKFANLSQAVSQEKVDAAISLPANTDQLVQQHQPIAVTVWQKSVKDITAQAQVRINFGLNAYNNQLIQNRLQQQNISNQILTATTLRVVDVATNQEKSGFGLSFILPLFIVMWAITGGMYTAIDASAGEKERKTLEALLLTPASRRQIVLGKFAAVATVSFIAILLSLGSLFVSFKYLIQSLANQSGTTGGAFGQLDISSSLTPPAMGLMLLTGILVALLFAAILLTVGIFAKSYREAQSYMSPIYIIAILPVAAINAAANFQLPDWLYAIPPLNAVQLFKELLKGQYNPQHIGLTLISLIIAAVIALIIATRIFNQEKVLFKQ